MYWCDYCKVWMNDNPATKATHENGIKHKDNVDRSKRMCATRLQSTQPLGPMLLHFTSHIHLWSLLCVCRAA